MWANLCCLKEFQTASCPELLKVASVLLWKAEAKSTLREQADIAANRFI